MSAPRWSALLLTLTLSFAGGCTRTPADGGWKEENGGIQCQELQHLACTGLYGAGGKGWAAKAIPPEVRPYEPGLQLWSDGLDKARFIYLPPGTKVETSNPDEWRFPVGTKLWKEFSWKGRRIETRFLWKRPDGSWLRTTYRWSDDEKTALELTSGEKNVPGTEGFEIPSQVDCQSCHRGRADEVLGFEAIALAHEGARGLTLAKLVEEGLLSHPPQDVPRVPGTPVEQAALGYLHMNCGVSCHSGNRMALGSSSGLHLRLEAGELGSAQATDTWRTSVGVKAFFQTSGLFGDSALRVAPGDVARSSVLHRMSQRGGAIQMPPLGTHVVDEQGRALIQRWIESMPAAKKGG
ncbi:hypothetical protein [Myxococcus sp. Y35]|uniref:hypothetical protein n=1 Tax=Pseudomyxococcus flavus TaxID=3115648 RepID=UPI003CEED261